MPRDTTDSDDNSEAGLGTGSTGDDRNSLFRWFAVAVVVAVLASSAFLRSASVVDPLIVVGGFGLVLVVAIVLAWRRSRSASGGRDDLQQSGGGDGDGDGDRDRDGSVWNAIPSWQYEGRHVESGGLTRGEQERALRDIQEQAEELSDDPSREP